MIGRAAGSVLDWYGSRRRRQLDESWRDPAGVQERALRRLTATARDTEFGLAHGFRGVRSVAEYQARVPVRDYVLTYERNERRRSLLADLAVGVVAGFGAESYVLALEGLVGWLRPRGDAPPVVQV